MNTVSITFRVNSHALAPYERMVVTGNMPELGEFDALRGVTMENVGATKTYEATVNIDLKDKKQTNLAYNFAKIDTRMDKVTFMKHDVGDKLQVCLKEGKDNLTLESTWLVGLRRSGSSGSFNGKYMEAPDMNRFFAPAR